MKYKTYELRHAENGFILTTTYHYKSSEKDPGHNRSRTTVATSVGDLMDILSNEIESAAIVIEGGAA